MALKINQKGFTLVEALFSLSICLIVVFSTAHILLLSSTTDRLPEIDASTEIGIKSLSQDLYTAFDFSYGNVLAYTDGNNRRNTIFLHNQRLVREPGFVIYTRDIEELYFYAIDHKVYVTVWKHDIEKTFLIGVDLYREN